MKDGSCRIIAGRWRGRKICFEDAEGLRPSTDRIRETLFNWLQGYVPGSRCLDCFAGSGVLGLEALSRGASEVTFIELNRRTADRISENCHMLSVEGCQVLNQDALEWIGLRDGSDMKYDLVFLDPPFHSGLLEECCNRLKLSGCLAGDAIIYVEHAIDESVKVPEDWTCLKEKVAGQVVFKLFRTA